MMKVYRADGSHFEGQSVESWDRTWEDQSIAEALRWAEISHLRPVFDQYFPKRGRILEAGCGLGQFVIHYHNRGYDIEGLDFSAGTIDRVRQFAPGVPLRVGDITALPYGDSEFDCYFSGGVVEHFEEGPFRPLAEARRVLSKDGTLILTVPFFNPLRRLKLRRTNGAPIDGKVSVGREAFVVEPPPRGFQFSEYYFTQQEFARILRDCGFTVVVGHPCDIEWGEVCQAAYRVARPAATAAVAPAGAAAAPSAPMPAAAADASLRGLLKHTWKDLFVSENRTAWWKRGVVDTLSAVSGHMLLFVCRPS